MSECICEGNWRTIVKEVEPLIGKQFRSSLFGDDNEYTFFGVVHGDDDYYYGMWREGDMKLLSCVGNLESWKFVLCGGGGTADAPSKAEC